MPTDAPDLLYLLVEDLFRLGNSTSPKLTNIRPRDVDCFKRDDEVLMIRANGKGISLFNQARMESSGLHGTIWMIPTGTQMPEGLGIYPDPTKPGHFMICPVNDMPMHQFCVLLLELENDDNRCKKVGKL
jgi:hypothetical protein